MQCKNGSNIHSYPSTPATRTAQLSSRIAIPSHAAIASRSHVGIIPVAEVNLAQPARVPQYWRRAANRVAP